jgi:hypothetical protein
MSRKAKTRTRRIFLSLTPEEYAGLLEKFRSTTHRCFSVYLRDLLNRQSVVVRYRNQSLDEFLPIAIKIKNELETVGKTFNLMLDKLNSLPHQGQLNDILEYFGAEVFHLNIKSREIKDLLFKIYQQCSQK